MKSLLLPKAALCVLLAITTIPKSVASDWIYYAQQGDTLWDLCLKYTNKRGCWIELAKYNAVRNDRAIPVGNEIRIPAAWLAQPPVVGKVIAVLGSVGYQVTRSASSQPLQQGQDLHLGARLVSQQGSARLELGTGNTLLLRNDSTLDLDTMSGPAGERSTAELILPEGAVEVMVVPDRKSRFRIETPAAIAAVRGTEYRVNSLPGGESMRGEVLSGSVEVASGQSATSVPAGFGVATRKGEAPGDLRKLLSAPVFTGTYASVNLPAEVSWDRNPGASSWVLDLVAADKPDVVQASYQTGEPGYVFKQLSDGCYTLNVRGVDEEGFNGLESSAPLCIVAKLQAVTGLSEIGQDPQNSRTKVGWSPTEGAQQYRLEVAADSAFSRIVDTRLTSDTHAEINSPTDADLFVRVIAIDAAGNESDTGDMQEFSPPLRTHWDYALLALLYLALVL